ncbi:MAG: hypothetical protein JO250_21265 [Armatimonadetes bacterium]|nr:hypothetical protein [Armatimonadota bacterium]
MKKIGDVRAQVEREKESVSRRFWKALGEQFGITLPDPEDMEAQAAALAAAEMTPEQRRRSELELEAATRGKEVIVPAAPPSRNAGPIAADPVDPDGTVHFDQVYAQAGVAPARFTAEQALELLQDSGTDDVARRQTIKVIAAFGKNVGATPDEIVVDATDKQDALHAFLQRRSDTLVEFQSRADEQLALLQAQIDRLHGLKAQAQTQHDAVTAACQAEIARLEQVRDFFRREVPAR